MNAKMCLNKYPKRNAAKFPKKWPRKCVVIVHPTRFIEAKDPLSQNLQNIPVPVHPMAVPIPVHPTKFIKANDLLSQNLQNMVILHPPITVRLYMKLYTKKNAKPSMRKNVILNTRKSAIRSPPHMGIMGLISPNPSANMSQWKNVNMFPKKNATVFPRMNANMCRNKYPKRNAAKFPKKWPRKYVVTSHNAPKHHY